MMVTLPYLSSVTAMECRIIGLKDVGGIPMDGDCDWCCYESPPSRILNTLLPETKLLEFGWCCGLGDYLKEHKWEVIGVAAAVILAISLICCCCCCCCGCCGRKRQQGPVYVNFVTQDPTVPQQHNAGFTNNSPI